MKEIVITLLILVSSDKIEQKRITIYESCYTWYKKNVAMLEKKTKLFNTRSYHLYKGDQVIGYMCNE
tara:strand:+ start:3645 stop:3845 length:201 start_codon:yes stop_codon:yes gene_type:complete